MSAIDDFIEYYEPKPGSVLGSSAKKNLRQLRADLAAAQKRVEEAEKVIFSGTHKARAEYLAAHVWLEEQAK